MDFSGFITLGPAAAMCNQALHFVFEVLIILFFLYRIQPEAKRDLSWRVLGAAFLALLLPLHLCVEDPVLGNAVFQLCVRGVCYFCCFFLSGRGTWKRCLFDALFCLVLSAAHLTMFETPLLVPFSRSMFPYLGWAPVDIVLSSFLEYLVCFLLFFFAVKRVDFSQPWEVPPRRYAPLLAALILQQYGNASLLALQGAGQEMSAGMSLYTILVEAGTAALLIAHEWYVSRKLPQAKKRQLAAKHKRLAELYALLADKNRELERAEGSAEQDLKSIQKMLPQNPEGALEHINALLAKGKRSTASVEDTGIPVLNGLLAEKASEAKKSGIELSVSLYALCLDHLHEEDASILFGTLLDNAMDTCLAVPSSERRYISLTGKEVDSDYIITVSSSCCTGKPGEENGRPAKGSQSDAVQPGSRLWDARTVAEKYSGTLDISYTDKACIVTVRLSEHGSFYKQYPHGFKDVIY